MKGEHNWDQTNNPYIDTRDPISIDMSLFVQNKYFESVKGELLKKIHTFC